MDCYLLLGSNMGDKKSLIEKACNIIESTCGRIIKKSSLYESEPWGFETDECFLNQVVVISSSLLPDELMQRLLTIEAQLGRQRTAGKTGYASRPIDLDILYYGNEVVHTEMVEIPHPRLHLRRFTLLPLCEVNPNFVHPVFKLTQAELLKNCTDHLNVSKL